jgi:hypothetical protein
LGQHPSTREKVLKLQIAKTRSRIEKKAKTKTATEKDFEYWYVECPRMARERPKSYK